MSKLALKVLLIPRVFDILFNKLLAADHPELVKVCRKFCKLLKANLSQQVDHVISAIDYQYSKFLRVESPCIKYIRKSHEEQKPGMVDVMVQVELRVLGTLEANRSYTLSYSYNYFEGRKGKTNTLCWQMQFNLVKGSRQVWIYKQQTRNHFAKDNISLIQDILPVRVGDVLVIRIPYLTRFGFTEMKTLQFYNLIKQNITVRQCQIQRHFEWTLYKYFDHPIQFEIEDIIRMYPHHLEVIQIRCAGVDYVNFKIRLRAKREGDLGQLLDHHLSILSSNSPIKAALKKRGCYQEEHTQLQLRVGDQLLIYHTPNF